MTNNSLTTSFKFQVSSFKLVVIGVSAGGMKALPEVLSPLPSGFPIPIAVVQHISPHSDNRYFVTHLNQRIKIHVKEADEKETIQTEHVYIAPPNYHLLIENDRNFALSVDEKVNYSRPSIDVLFETAAEVYGTGLIGVILTGASSDGANGLKRIKKNGGVAIVQDPDTAEAKIMPQSAIDACEVDYMLSLEEIGSLLKNLGTGGGNLKLDVGS